MTEIEKELDRRAKIIIRQEKQIKELKARNDQFTEAKELIKQLMYSSRDCIAWYCLCDKAKQFLKENEK